MFILFWFLPGAEEETYIPPPKEPLTTVAIACTQELEELGQVQVTWEEAWSEGTEKSV